MSRRQAIEFAAQEIIPFLATWSRSRNVLSWVSGWRFLAKVVIREGSPHVEPEHLFVVDRRGLRYPSDLSDAVSALVEPLIPSAMRGGAP